MKEILRSYKKGSIIKALDKTTRTILDRTILKPISKFRARIRFSLLYHNRIVAFSRLHMHRYMLQLQPTAELSCQWRRVNHVNDDNSP